MLRGCGGSWSRTLAGGSSLSWFAVTLRDFVEFPTVAEVLDAGEVSGGRISDRCGSFVEGVRGDGRLLQHVTRRPPRRAPCLARHYQVTMRASFQRVGPGKPGPQLPVRDG